MGERERRRGAGAGPLRARDRTAMPALAGCLHGPERSIRGEDAGEEGPDWPQRCTCADPSGAPFKCSLLFEAKTGYIHDVEIIAGRVPDRHRTLLGSVGSNVCCPVEKP